MRSGSILVFDVGGTSLRAGIYSLSTSRLERTIRRGTPSLRTLPGRGAGTIRERLFHEMAEMARELLGERPPAIVSVAFPGPIAPDGRVLAAPTVWGGDGATGPVPLGDVLRGFWAGARVYVLNDISAAGYCYLNDPLEDFCILTVSSGIGHKVFVRGQPVTGPNGRGGELGHLRVDFTPDAPACDCGGKGHLGAVASGSAVAHQMMRLEGEDRAGFLTSELGRRAVYDVGRVDNEAIVAAFLSSDPWTQRVVRRMARPIGQVLAAIHLAVGVERFVIIGGFAIALGSGFREMLSIAAAECTWDLGAEWDAMVELGREDEHAELVGAGRFAAASLGEGAR